MMFFFKGKRNARQLHVSKHSCPTRRVSELEKNEISTARAALEELASQSGVVAFTPGGGGQALLRLRARSENRYSNLMALRLDGAVACATGLERSEEHTSELQSLMRNSYAVLCLKKK